MIARLILLAVWLIPALARADARVVLTVLAPDNASARAMQARAGSELEQRGFAVVSHTPEQGASPPESTLARARSVGAVVGVVLIVDEHGGARIEVIDRVTSKRLQRSLAPATDGHGSSTIALAVAELVDASLVELQLPAKTAVGEIPAPPDLPTPQRDRVLGKVGVTVGLLWPVRSAAPVGVVSAEIGLRPSTRVALLAEATLPLHAMRSDVPLAMIRTLPFLVGVRTDVDVAPARSRLRVDLQGAIDAIALHGAVARHVHLGGSLRVVAPFDDIRIRFDGALVQRLGPVWIGGGASIHVRW